MQVDSGRREDGDVLFEDVISEDCEPINQEGMGPINEESLDEETDSPVRLEGSANSICDISLLSLNHNPVFVETENSSDINSEDDFKLKLIDCEKNKTVKFE